MPTAEMALACVRVCHMLSNGYQPIHVFRYDEKTGSVFILAGKEEGIEIVVKANGLWELVI